MAELTLRGPDVFFSQSATSSSPIGMKTTKEIPLKQWLSERAAALNISYHAAEMRLWRGRLNPPRLRRINSRVVLVLV